MRTLLAAALLLGASTVVARAEWEILESPNMALGVAAEVVEGSTSAPDIARITRALERAGYTDVKLERLPVWSGTAIKDRRKVMLQIDAYGQIIDQK